MKEVDLSFTIIPANKAMAITGENPDQASFVEKNNFESVVTTTSRSVNVTSL